MSDLSLEPVLDPGLPICDPHHHLWPGYLLPQLQADLASGHHMVSTVYAEWQWGYLTEGPPEMRPVGEVACARNAGEQTAGGPTRICDGIVGFVDLTLGDATLPVLEAAIAAGRGRLKGLRHVGSWDDDPEVRGGTVARGPGLYGERAFRAGVALLRPLGLSFDALVFQTQLDDVTDLARAFPDQPIVLNHSGGVLGIGRYAGCRDELFASWRLSMRELATCPNVSVKLSGLGMKRCGFPFYGRPETMNSPAIAAAWWPWIETCIELFGIGRCFFASNFPVDAQCCSYRVLWNAFKRLAAGASPAERAALFHDTAARFYRLRP